MNGLTYRASMKGLPVWTVLKGSVEEEHEQASQWIKNDWVTNDAVQKPLIPWCVRQFLLRKVNCKRGILYGAVSKVRMMRVVDPTPLVVAVADKKL